MITLLLDIAVLINMVNMVLLNMVRTVVDNTKIKVIILC